MKKRINSVLLSTAPWYSLFGSSFPYVPLGLSFVAGYLEQRGYNIKIINPDSFMARRVIDPDSYDDCDAYESNLINMNYFVWKALKHFLSENQFDVLGISVMISQFLSAHKFAELSKKINPECIVVFGGIGPTVIPELAFEDSDFVDFVVRGEGEVTFSNLLENLRDGKSVDGIKGISYRKDGEIKHNPDASLIHDLDTLPHPAKHLYVPMDKQELAPIAYGRLFTSRGCPYGCTYCDSYKLWTKKVRKHSPEYIVEEIRQLREHYNVNLFVFDDDTFALDKSYTDKLLDLIIGKNLNISWRCETRANFVTHELIGKMKRAGCRSITIGVESGNEEILRRIHKGVTTNQVREASKIIKENGVLLNAFFMFGFPWETEKEIEDTINFLYSIAPNGEVGAVHSYLVPYPGTKIYEEIEQMGMLPNLPLYKMHHRNWSLKFTPHISTVRFAELTKEINSIFKNYNLKRRVQLLFFHPRYFFLNLQQRGYLSKQQFILVIKTLLKKLLR